MYGVCCTLQLVYMAKTVKVIVQLISEYKFMNMFVVVVIVVHKHVPGD